MWGSDVSMGLGATKTFPRFEATERRPIPPGLGYHAVERAHRRLMNNYADLLDARANLRGANRRRFRPWRWLTVWPLVGLYVESHVRRRLGTLRTGYVRLEQRRQVDAAVGDWAREYAEVDLERIRSTLARYPDMKALLGVVPLGVLTSVVAAGYGYVTDPSNDVPITWADVRNAAPAIAAVTASIFAALMAQSFLTKRALLERLGTYRREGGALRLVTGREVGDFAFHVLGACLVGLVLLVVWRETGVPDRVATAGAWWTLWVTDLVCVVQLAWSQFLNKGYRV
jgi:hypothetical protein